MPSSICIVAAAPVTVRVFLMPHIEALRRQYHVTVISNFPVGEDIDLDGVTTRSVPLQRAIRPLHDLIALWRLWCVFKSQRYDFVLSISPKAGLLAMTAAWLARVPARTHWFTGQVWVTRQGWFRQLLKSIDRLIARLTNLPLVDSPSQLAFLRKQGVLSATQGTVLASGSVCGVDCDRFRPDPDRRRDIRQRLALPETAIVALYVGRMNRDKGVPDLVSAFRCAAAEQPNLYLLLVGPDEEQILGSLHELSGEAADRLRTVGSTNRPEDFMAAADFFCLPSHREGFGSAVIEAAACGLPAIASRIYGLTDAVVEGQAGLLHQPGDVEEIARLMCRFAEDLPLRTCLGRGARERVLTEFSQERLVGALLEFIRAKKGTDECA